MKPCLSCFVTAKPAENNEPNIRVFSIPSVKEN